MNARAVVLSLFILTLVGCAGVPALPPVGADHPANPDAPEVAPKPPPETLAIQSATYPTTAPVITSAPTSGQGEHHHGH
jgi:hypothetical protein